MRFAGGVKQDKQLEDLKKMVNIAVETFVDASKKAEEKMAFRAFTLRDMELDKAYALSDIILTQAAIHLSEYTPHSLDKYTYTTATAVETEDETDSLVVWFNFSREAPPAPEKVELTDKDINPYVKKEEEPVEEAEKKDIVEETLVEASGMGHTEPEKHIRCGATYDA